MKHNYYTYASEDYECQKCKWKGKGKDTELGEFYAELSEINCPVCHEPITFISHPTIEETLTYGSDKEKEDAIERQKIMKIIQEMQLKDKKQLPDIKKPDIIFSLEVSDDLEYILLMHNNTVIWKEMRIYEYYDRYFEIGKLLKLKYKDNIIDFIPPDEVDRVYFYGDCGNSTINKIDNFRKKLKKAK